MPSSRRPFRLASRPQALDQSAAPASAESATGAPGRRPPPPTRPRLRSPARPTARAPTRRPRRARPRSGAMPRAPVRIDLGSVTSASATVHRSALPPTERRDTPPIGPAGVGTPAVGQPKGDHWCPRTSAKTRRSRAARQRARARGDRRPALPPRSPATSRTASGSALSLTSNVFSIRRGNVLALSSPNRRRLRRRISGSSSSASGFPLVLATIRSRIWASIRTRMAVARIAFASPLSSPRPRVGAAPRAHRRDREPRRSNRSVREKPPRDEGEGTERSPVQPLRVIDHAEQGRSSATSDSRLSTARPTRKRSGAFPPSTRTRSGERRVGGPAAFRAGRASGRTTGAGPRTAAPSPNPHPPPARR